MYKTGTLADTTPFIVNVGGDPAPMTASITSAAAGRKIRLSSTGNANSYYDAVYDGTTASMLNVSIKSPLRTVEFTGQAGDTWEIR